MTGHHFICFKLSKYPGPGGFPWFSPWESCVKAAAKRWTRVATQRERETSGYFGLESHYHEDARVKIWPSGSDWFIFLQTRKSIRLVHLIGNTEGTVGIFVTALTIKTGNVLLNFPRWKYSTLIQHTITCHMEHSSRYTTAQKQKNGMSWYSEPCV